MTDSIINIWHFSSLSKCQWYPIRLPSLIHACPRRFKASAVQKGLARTFNVQIKGLRLVCIHAVLFVCFPSDVHVLPYLSRLQ